MLSYLSKPLQSTIKPFEDNIGLIAKVAEQKQNKYDEVLNAIFKKESELLDIDTSANRLATERKDTMLKKADEDLSSMARLDLLNPENIKRVENLFTPIVTDKYINEAASLTAHAKSESKFFDEWKKDGKGLYSSKNENYFWIQYAKNRDMSLDEMMTNGVKPMATEYTDIDKLFRETVKDMHPEITQVVNSNGQYIYTTKTKVLSEEDILSMLPSDSKIYAQAEINAYYDYANVKPEEILGSQRDILSKTVDNRKATIDQIDKESNFVRDQIRDIEAKNTKGNDFVMANGGDRDLVLKELQEKLKGYDSQRTIFSTKMEDGKTALKKYEDEYEYDPNTKKFNKQLSEDQINSLKTQNWLYNRKTQFASAWAYKDVEMDMKVDEFGKMYVQNQYKLNEMEVQHQYNMAEDAFKESLKQGMVDTDGDGIVDTKVSDDYLGATTAEDAIGVEQPTPGNEFNSLNANLGQKIQEKSNLVNRYVSLLSATGNKWDANRLMQEFTNYNRVYNEYTNGNHKGSDKIPGAANQTYDQYFSDPNIKRIAEFSRQHSEVSNDIVANQEIIAQINKKAKDEAYRLLPNGKFVAKDLEFNFKQDRYVAPAPGSKFEGYWTSRSENLIVPASLSEKFVQNSLTSSELKELYNLNSAKLKGVSLDDFSKSIMSPKDESGSTITIINSDIYNNLRSSFIYSKNKFASEYGKGYLQNALYIKDINTAKSIGKYVNDAAKQYVKTVLPEDVKLKNADVEIVKFVKNPKTLSGWDVIYKTVVYDDQQKVVQGQGKIEQVALKPDFVSMAKLDNIYNVTSIEQNLNSKWNGNDGTSGMYNGEYPSYVYNYQGKVYKFVMTAPSSYMLTKKVGDQFVPFLGTDNSDIESVQQGLALIQKENQYPNAR